MNFKKDGFVKTEKQIKKVGLASQAAVNLFDVTITQLRASNNELATLHQEVEANIVTVQAQYESDMITLGEQRDTIVQRIAHNSEIVKNIERIVATSKHED